MGQTAISDAPEKQHFDDLHDGRPGPGYSLARLTGGISLLRSAPQLRPTHTQRRKAAARKRPAHSARSLRLVPPSAWSYYPLGGGSHEKKNATRAFGVGSTKCSRTEPDAFYFIRLIDILSWPKITIPRIAGYPQRAFFLGKAFQVSRRLRNSEKLPGLTRQGGFWRTTGRATTWKNFQRLSLSTIWSARLGRYGDRDNIFRFRRNLRTTRMVKAPGQLLLVCSR